LEYDTTQDGTLKPDTVQRLVLEAANGQIVGRPMRSEDEPKKEKDRSLYAGQVITGSTPVVTLRQDEPAGRVVVYVGQVVAQGRIAGTFSDNQGGKGDWSLTLVTERFLEPSARVPDEVLLESVLGVYGEAVRGKRHPFVNLRPPQRNLWTEEVQKIVKGTLSYGEVDYIGTAKLVIVESGTYTLDIPGAGVEIRVNGERMEAGDLELKRGLYEVEIYTNHWGQPYLTYAEVNVFKKGTKVRIPFVNYAKDIEAFRSKKFEGRPVVEACTYTPTRVELERNNPEGK
jgi:hypothetical protein